MQKRSLRSVKIFYPEFDLEELIKRISERLPKLEELLQIKLVVLFGSYARGCYTIASDVDLLVVYEGTPKEDPYHLVKKAIGLRGLEPHVYSISEYAAMWDTIEKMTKGGIVLLDKRGGSTVSSWMVPG